MGYRIGLDVGGTFTDAVIIDQNQAVVAATKSRTTADRSGALAASIDAVLTAANLSGDQIELVSLATTIATNALVEGAGGPVGLIFIGFDEAELQRDGLQAALGGGTAILTAGGHNSMGKEREPLDVGSVVAQARELEVDAFAVAAQFSVRNPSHELAVRDALLPLGKPVRL